MPKNTKFRTYDENGTLVRHETKAFLKRYDSGGRLVQHINNNATRDVRKEYEYLADGDVVCNTYDSTDRLVYVERSDSDGNRLSFSWGDDPDSNTEYERDELGRETRRLTIESDSTWVVTLDGETVRDPQPTPKYVWSFYRGREPNPWAKVYRFGLVVIRTPEFDGTYNVLTGHKRIDDPERANLAESTRNEVTRLAKQCYAAVDVTYRCPETGRNPYPK